jgi:hypothetical protein
VRSAAIWACAAANFLPRFLIDSPVVQTRSVSAPTLADHEFKDLRI